jgi:hypothetical protein
MLKDIQKMDNTEEDTGVSSSESNDLSGFRTIRRRRSGCRNRDTSGGRVRANFFIDMRDLPLQNKSMILLRIALFNRILEFSEKTGLILACFIVGGIKLAKTADFEIYLNTKKKVTESLIADFINGLYSVPDSNFSVQVMHVPANKAANLIKRISKIDIECIWHNEDNADSPNLICEAKMHSR